MEFCSTDDEGRPTDEGMFGDLDQVDSSATQRRMLRRLLAQGLTAEAIKRTWPDLAPLLASEPDR